MESGVVASGRVLLDPRRHDRPTITATRIQTTRLLTSNRCSPFVQTTRLLSRGSQVRVLAGAPVDSPVTRLWRITGSLMARHRAFPAGDGIDCIR